MEFLIVPFDSALQDESNRYHISHSISLPTLQKLNFPGMSLCWDMPGNSEVQSFDLITFSTIAYKY